MMKVVIVGGSAHSTPALFDTDRVLDAARFSFALVGRSRERLAAVRRAIACVTNERGARVDCVAHAGEPDAALAEADVVLVQFRIGGYEARANDETFPHAYGVCGDEGLGPGGLASAWRSWGELSALLTTVERSCPRALIVLLTSPVGILTRCARTAFPALQLYGICELPWTTLAGLCAARAADVRCASYAYLAVNHLGWFSDVRANGKAIVSRTDAHPLKYVQLADRAAEVLAEQRASGARGLELARLAQTAFGVYADGSPAAVAAAVRARATPWYAHAVAPLLRSLAGEDTGVTYFLTARNDDYTARLEADAIIEMPYRIRGGRLERVATAPWPRDDIAKRLARLVAYERLAADAVMTRDARTIEAALSAHPWLDGVPVTASLVADVTGCAPAAFATSQA